MFLMILKPSKLTSNDELIRVFTKYLLCPNCVSHGRLGTGSTRRWRQHLALAGVAWQIGMSSHNGRVASVIPSWGTGLGFGFHPPSRHIPEATDRCFSPSLPLFLKAVRMKCPQVRIKKITITSWPKLCFSSWALKWNDPLAIFP